MNWIEIWNSKKIKPNLTHWVYNNNTRQKTCTWVLWMSEQLDTDQLELEVLYLTFDWWKFSECCIFHRTNQPQSPRPDDIPHSSWSLRKRPDKKRSDSHRRWRCFFSFSFLFVFHQRQRLAQRNHSVAHLSQFSQGFPHLLSPICCRTVVSNSIGPDSCLATEGENSVLHM